MNITILDITNNMHINHKAREWCLLPYPNHPKGCPNYGRKWCCPPEAPILESWLGNYKRVSLICIEFNLKEHMEKMIARHSQWSLRQARCLLYWQRSVNKQLAEATSHFALNRLNGVTYCPEAMGLNVIATAQAVGLPIKTKPNDIVYKISLVKVVGEDG